MTAFALISGSLFKAPERKVSKNGNAFATATVKMRADDNRTEFWRLVTFSESAVEELMRLNEGDNLSAQGQMKAELYQPEGKEPRISLSIIADTVQPLRAQRKRQPQEGDEKPMRRSRAAQAANGSNEDFRLRSYGGHSHDASLNDDIGF
jgi:single-stranded DNA-binding protein